MKINDYLAETSTHGMIVSGNKDGCIYVITCNYMTIFLCPSVTVKIWELLDGCQLHPTVPLNREEEVSSCQDQLGEFRRVAGALGKWLEETAEKVPSAQPNSSVKSLEKDLQIVSVSGNIN